MIDFGIVKPGTTLYIPFNTFDSNDPSASVTITGLATTDIEVYKDGSTTQRASDSGYALLDTDGIDFDSITGIHGISINLADNTTAGFWAAGSQYWVVISSITVDAATINFLAATFRIGYPDALLNTTIATLASQTSFTLTSGPAEDSALLGCPVLIHDVASAVQLGFGVISAYTGSTKTVTLTAATTFTAAATDNISIYPPANTKWFAALTTSALPLAPTTAGRTLDVSAGGEAGIDWANVGSPTTTVGLTGTTISTSQAVASVSGAVGSVTGNVGGNVTGSVGSVTGNVGGNVTGSVGSVTGGINTGAGVITTLDGLDTAQDTQHATTQSAVATVDTVVDAILVDTAEIGVAGAGLTEAGGTGDHLTAVATAAALATVDTNVDAILVDTGTTIPAQISGLNNLSAAQVNAEVVDALNTDTYAEPAQGTPGASITLAAKIGYLYKAWRNRSTQTATTYSLYNDDATTVDHKATVSDDGTTADKGEISTGP